MLNAKSDRFLGFYWWVKVFCVLLLLAYVRMGGREVDARMYVAGNVFVLEIGLLVSGYCVFDDPPFTQDVGKFGHRSLPISVTEDHLRHSQAHQTAG